MIVIYFVFPALAALLSFWFFFERRKRKTAQVQGGLDRSVRLEHTHEIEVYSNSFSHCSRKVRLAVAELGLPAKHRSVELIETGWYQSISPEYLKINPSGLVPTMLHNGHPVYESDDILTYAQQIADAHAPSLTPDDPTACAEMHKWLSFCAISSENALEGMQTRAGACIPGLTLPLFAANIQYVPLHKILIGFLFHFDKKRPAFLPYAKCLAFVEPCAYHSSKASCIKAPITCESIWPTSRKHSKRVTARGYWALTTPLQTLLWLVYYCDLKNLVGSTGFRKRTIYSPSWITFYA